MEYNRNELSKHQRFWITSLQHAFLNINERTSNNSRLLSQFYQRMERQEYAQDSNFVRSHLSSPIPCKITRRIKHSDRFRRSNSSILEAVPLIKKWGGVKQLLIASKQHSAMNDIYSVINISSPYFIKLTHQIHSTWYTHNYLVSRHQLLQRIS